MARILLSSLNNTSGVKPLKAKALLVVVAPKAGQQLKIANVVLYDHDWNVVDPSAYAFVDPFGFGTDYAALSDGNGETAITASQLFFGIELNEATVLAGIETSGLSIGGLDDETPIPQNVYFSDLSLDAAMNDPIFSYVKPTDGTVPSNYVDLPGAIAVEESIRLSATGNSGNNNDATGSVLRLVRGARLMTKPQLFRPDNGPPELHDAVEVEMEPLKVYSHANVSADLAERDASQYVRWEAAVAKALTIPQNVGNFPEGGVARGRNVGLESLTISPALNVLLNGGSGSIIIPSGGEYELRRLTYATGWEISVPSSSTENSGGSILAWVIVTADTLLTPGRPYVADARLGPLSLTLPNPLTPGDSFVVRAHGGAVTIFNSGLLIEEIGAGNHLGMLTGETVSLAALDAATLIMVN